MNNGQTLLQKANETRELGNFPAALKLLDEALYEFQKEGDVAKMSETLASRALTLRHLAEQTGDDKYALIAKHAAMAGVELIEKSGSSIGLPVVTYTLGKCQETLGEDKEAIESYKKASKALGGDDKAMASEIETRLAALDYKMGDSSAVDRFNEAYSELELATFDDEYVKNVWLSGAHMHMAKAYIAREDNERAKEEISKAREIIDSDGRLTLRAKQLEKLDSQIS